MTWQRIDENTYIDDTLVTCAEYQLFIDEMREQGDYYQPDHWRSYQFPDGHGREPILGMRQSDAVAFCKWLSKRETNKLKFRLPTRKEADAHIVNVLGIIPLGYWIDAPYQFCWIEPFPKNALEATIKFALDRTRNFENKFALDFSNALDRFRILNRTVPKNLEPNLDIAIERVINRAINRARKRAQSRGLDLEHTLDRTFEHALYRDLDRAIEYGNDTAIVHARDHNHLLNRDFDNVIARIRTHVRDQNRYRAIDILRDIDSIFSYIVEKPFKNAHDLDLDLDLIFDNQIDSYTFAERTIGHSLAFEGIRLIKERIR